MHASWIKRTKMTSKTTNFHCFTKTYWNSASLEEKNRIVKLHQSRLLKGFEAWNAWASEFYNFVQENHCDDPVLCFQGAKFSQALDLAHYHFPFHSIFRFCQFEAQMRFSYATFHHKANFTHALFKENCDFSSCVFQQEVSFQCAHFQKDSMFSQALFTGTAQFPQVQFDGQCRFSSARFVTDCDFSEAHFKEQSEFKSLECQGAASFSLCQFDQTVNYKRASFAKAASFEEAKFYQDVNFSALTFNRLSINDEQPLTSMDEKQESLAEPPISFYQTRFYSDVDFKSSHFPSGANFEFCQFHKQSNFNSTKFHQLPDFRHSIFLENPNLQQMDITFSNESLSGENKLQHQHLLTLAEKAHAKPLIKQLKKNRAFLTSIFSAKNIKPISQIALILALLALPPWHYDYAQSNGGIISTNTVNQSLCPFLNQAPF